METVFETKPRTSSQGDPIYSNVASFDTDMGQIGADNQASTCISHKISDFAGTLQKVNEASKGFGGMKTYGVMEGKLVWKWYDNDDWLHQSEIPNSCYLVEVQDF